MLPYGGGGGGVFVDITKLRVLSGSFRWALNKITGILIADRLREIRHEGEGQDRNDEATSQGMLVATKSRGGKKQIPPTPP